MIVTIRIINPWSLWLVSWVNKALITTFSTESVVMGIIMSLVRSIFATVITAEASHFFLLRPASSQDPLVGLLMLLFGWVK